MNKRLTIALAATVLAAMATCAAAGSRRESITAADALPAYEVLNSIRALGFAPTTQALRRGPYYVLHAYDPRGVQVRITADAQLGDIVEVSSLVAPRFSGGARIIHVPQRGERNGRRDITYDNQAADAADGDDRAAAPPAPRRTIRSAYQHHDAPITPPSSARVEQRKSLSPPRNVLSAPPPSGNLTPIYPTPRFDPKIEPAEKFAPQDERSQNIPAYGYVPTAID